MNKLLRYIYKYDFGLYYPFYVFSKLLRILCEKAFGVILDRSSSCKTKESREKGWRMATSIFNQDFDDIRWFYLIDFYVVIFIGGETMFITCSVLAGLSVMALVLGAEMYLFDYKDKRKKQFFILRCEPRTKKVLWTIISYTCFIVIWYICWKIKPILNPKLEFLGEWDSKFFY